MLKPKVNETTHDNKPRSSSKSKRRFSRSKSPSRSRKSKGKSSPNEMVRRVARLSLSKQRILKFGRDADTAIFSEQKNSIPQLKGFSTEEISEVKMAYYLDKEFLHKHVKSLQHMQKRAVESILWHTGGIVKLFHLGVTAYLYHVRSMRRELCTVEPGVCQNVFQMSKQRSSRRKGSVKKNKTNGLGARTTSEIKLPVQHLEKRMDSGSQAQSEIVEEGAKSESQQKIAKSPCGNAKLSSSSNSVEENPFDPTTEFKDYPCPLQSTLIRQYYTKGTRAADLIPKTVPLQQGNVDRRIVTLIAIEGIFKVNYELIGGEYQVVEITKTPRS